MAEGTAHARALLLLRTFAVALALGIVAVQFTLWLRPPPLGQLVVETGTVDVGGPFALTDQHGRRVSNVDLHGKTVVLMFGWTRDPDVTPATLQLLGAAIDRLGPKTESFVPVFITVDPERDGTDEMRAFSMRYHQRLVALRGTSADTQHVTAAFRLPVTRIVDTMLPGGYSLELPALYYVLGADGHVRGVVSYTPDVASLAADIARLGRN